MERKLKFVIFRDASAYVARCLDVEVTSDGGTEAEAVTNLAEALDLYFEHDANGLATLVPRTYRLGEVAVHA